MTSCVTKLTALAEARTSPWNGMRCDPDRDHGRPAMINLADASHRATAELPQRAHLRDIEATAPGFRIWTCSPNMADNDDGMDTTKWDR